MARPRRRRPLAALAGVVGVALLAVAAVVAVGLGRDEPVALAPATTAPTATATTRATVPDTIATTATAIAAPTAAPPGRPPPLARPGDLVITGVAGTSPSRRLLLRARRGQFAGVILMGHNIESVAQVRRLVGSLQRAARAGGQPPLLVAVDQEGGTVRRIRTAPPRRSARELAAAGPAALRAVGRRTARDLRSHRISVDFAPVADVRTVAGNFLGSRAFGTDPAFVAARACAFAGGLRDGGVVPTLKHFPGLGAAGSLNTDDGAVAIAAPRSILAAGLAPYRRCAREAPTLVMVANASYARLTGRMPAVLSHETYRLARAEGIPGPFVTDSLDAAALRGRRDVAPRAVRAGVNLLLYTSEGSGDRGYKQLREAVRVGAVGQSTLEQRAAPVRALRAALAP